MEQGRLGANGTTRRRSSGRAAQKPGSSDPELSAARPASVHAARKPGSSDPELSAAGRVDDHRGRLGGRGATGRRRTGPVESSFDASGVLTHRMMADSHQLTSGHPICLRTYAVGRDDSHRLQDRT